MAKKQKNKKFFKNKIKSYFIAIALLFVLFWALVPLPRLIKSSKELNRLEQELAQIQEENQGLKKELENIKKDRYIELAAREQLDLAKPGEETYIVVKQEKPKPQKKDEKGQGLLSSAIDFFKQLLGYKQ